MTSRDIGLRVTKVREAKGLSTVGLARRVGISQAQISRLENGKQGFRSSTLISIAEALETPPFFFFMSDEEWKTYEAGLEARGPLRIESPVGQE
jgi:transcriptional regulator with XRE-family HTH domain